MRTRLGRTVLIQTLAVCGAAVASSTAHASGPVESQGFEIGTAKIEGYVYVNAKTGEVRRTPASAIERRGDNYWKNDDTTGSCNYFMQQDLPTRDTAATGRVRFGSAVVHWGDIPVGGRVDGFDVGYATNVGVDPTGAGVPGLDLTAVFIDDYDGDLNPGGTGASGIGGFLLEDIPGGNGATGVQGWIYIVDLEGSGLEFDWGSSDLDGDGLHDFGYSYSFDQNQTSAKGVAGPLLVRPFSLGGAGTATGCPDLLDWFNGGDDFTGYFGGLWFGGGSCPARPYASTYLNVYGSTISQELNAFGLDHTASGSATLGKIVTPAGPALAIGGLGGGSGDRVSVDVGATRQMKIEMGASSTTHGTQVVEFNGTLMAGGPPQLLGSLTAIDDAEGVKIRPNFAPVGASTFTAEVYDHGTLVARVPGQTEFELLPAELPIWLIIVIIIIVIIWLSDEDCEVEASMTVPAGVTAVIAGMALHGDTIRMIPDAAQPPLGHLTSVDTFTTGVDSLVFHGESVGVSGVDVSALGEAALAPAEDRITITNIGSSGQDGIRMLPVHVSTIDWAFDQPCFDCPLCPDGRWADVAAIGSFGGVPDHPLGSIRFTAVGPDWRINADYSAVGSAAKRLVAYKDGAIVQQITGFTGGVVGMVQDPPSGCGKGLAIIDGRHTACYFVRWPTAGTHLTIPGHSTIVCDGLAVLAEAPTADVGAVSEIAIKSSSIPQMIVFDVTRTAYCPVDLNQDGIVDFLDYLDFLNRFEIGDPAVDFNHDGIVDFLDYLEFLNLFNEGC